MRKIFLFVFGLSVFVFTSFVVNAESIKQFDVEIEVNKDGSAEVLEKILYDFDWQDRHGIFRDIPNLYGEEGVFMNVNFLSVTDEIGDSYMFSYEDVDGYERVRVGDPDSTLSGEHWYYITYTIDGVVNGFEDNDELYWNVTGDMWEVPIENVSAIITLPVGDGSEVSKAVCYNGYYGDSYTDCTYDFSGRTATYKMNNSLAALQQLTVVVAFDKGLAALSGFIKTSVDPSYSTLFVDGKEFGSGNHAMRISEGAHEIEVSHGIRYEPYFDEIEIVYGETFVVNATLEKTFWGYFFELIFPILFNALALFLVITLWYKKGRDPKGRGTIMPFYKPPEEISPGEAGILIDEKADLHDITATIIQLAVKGYLHIKKDVEKKFLWGKDINYVFIKKKEVGSKSSLLEYEKEVFNAIFDDSTKKEVELKKLQKRFYKALPNIKKSFYQQAIDKDYFKENPDSVRGKYIGGSIFLNVFLFFPAAVFLTGIFESLLYLPFVFVGILLFVLSFFMGKKTIHGVEMYEKVLGHKMFIETAEKDRLKTLFSPKEYKDVFEKNLPYAMVYGIDGEWGKQFEGLYDGVPNWYEGDDDFHGFTRSMVYFTHTSVRALTVNPNGGKSGGGWSGGSGFSGGFSGGGFGGGGGGSW